MSAVPEEMIKKLLDTFISKAESISTALVELRAALTTLNNSQAQVIEKLDELRLEIRELATRIEMALRR